ncbi:MAG: SMP-30/gluconolactonase/LRE family protein [Actinomycetota bacterium]|nr:SMP-30/gluconolactonase/LRE family protein [Actinomycetota bacterium]MDQ3732456.1 SMP-30/gluconolactonase/LRE family protein [Actinomycetota bacterium]
MAEPELSLVAEVVLDAHAEVGEGPTWDVEGQRLWWVDIPRGAVHAFDPATGTDDVITVDQPVGAVVLRRSGGLLLAVRDGFAALEEGRLRLLAAVEIDRPENRMNDGKVDPAGRFWAGTMALDMAPGAGALYRLVTDQQVDTVLTGLTISNGMDWSPDGHTMYFIDSGPGRVTSYSYDRDSGEISEPRTLIEIAPEDGLPDGMTVDSAGGLWVAIWDGAAVRHYSTDGTFLDEIRVPARQVTSCAFGGPELRDLYITSAAEDLSPEQLVEQPHAGALFRVTPGVVGRDPHLCNN